MFLAAVAKSLQCTRSFLGDAFFDARAGVKQGGSSSSSLFTFYINLTIRKIAQFGVDAFLGLLHCLLLMDDTIIIATSQKAMQCKLSLLTDVTRTLKLTIHSQKSIFFAINTDDTESFSFDGVVITYMNIYHYLGTPVSNNPMSKQVADHAQGKQCHVRKFFSFLAKNSDALFEIKKKVWESALTSTILYSCETWMVNDISPVHAQYLSTLNGMLGVRSQTPNKVVYAELGVPPLKALVKRRQKRFLEKIWSYLSIFSLLS